MPNIKPVDSSRTDTKTAAALDAAKRRLGLLPNLFTTLANAPAAFAGYLQFNEALAGGRLSPRQRESIALAVAQENGCGYCLSAHTAIGKMVGLSDVELRDARRGSASDRTDGAIVAFALRVARTRGKVSATELDALRQTGIDDGLIIEIIAHVALNVLTNYVNNVAATEIDFPRVDLDAAA